MRAGIPADHFPPPFANENAARANNGGALPPDLSLIVKAREGGAQYVYSIVTGDGSPPPHGFKVLDGKYYDPYFAGRNISMPPPLRDDSVTYSDGTRRRSTRKRRTSSRSWPGHPSPSWKSASGSASA